MFIAKYSHTKMLQIFSCVVSVEDSIAMQVGKQFKETDSRDYGEFNVKIYGDEKMANI